eukprot:SAG11_NODE_3829_length_2187_cov_1.302857_4_plen_73_part_00
MLPKEGEAGLLVLAAGFAGADAAPVAAAGGGAGAAVGPMDGGGIGGGACFCGLRSNVPSAPVHVARVWVARK